MPSNNLDGPLPDLTGLIRLSSLILCNNFIKLPLPALPTSLTEIDLSSSFQQVGDSPPSTIPDLSYLTQLDYLNISNNSLLSPDPGASSPLPQNLTVLDLSNNIISDQDTGAIPFWLSLAQLGSQIIFMNLSMNSFCGFLASAFIPPSSASLRLDLRNNSFYCPLPQFNSSLVSADCEPLLFRSISPMTGPSLTSHDPHPHIDSRLFRIFADGISDYYSCISYLMWRCRMTFVNSSDPIFGLADWKPGDNCIVCRQLPAASGILMISVELFESPSLWHPVIQATAPYCQVRMALAVPAHAILMLFSVRSSCIFFYFT